MSQSDYRPRLSTELTHESYRRLSEILPHGWQKPLFQSLVNGVISLYDKGGVPAIGAIVSNHLEIDAIIQSSKNGSYVILKQHLKKMEAENGNNPTP